MSSRRSLDWLLLGAAGAFVTCSFAACSDSIHLDPAPAATGGTTTSTGGDGGGGAGGGGTGGDVTSTTSSTTTSTGSGGGCKSNADCPDDPAAPESSICDAVYGNCVECLVFSDCQGKPGTVCKQGACVCPDSTESYCAPLGNQSARCVDLATDPQDCGSCGHQCFLSCGGGNCTDAWEPISTINAPSARSQHVAVWTNTNQMVVWGGDTSSGPTNTGGVYDPATGAWSGTSTASAPSPRKGATAVWATTTSEMLVWGGTDGAALGTGARYDAAANQWTPIKVEGAPAPRFDHTAIWTGAKMIVWGGHDANGTILNDGASYDPNTDTWVALPTVDNTGTAMPTRYGHTAVWTNAVMLIWGGRDGANALTNGGYAYNDAAASWTPINSAISSTPGARDNHTATWTGTEMLIWGGFTGGYANDGDTFNYANNVWGKDLGTPMITAPIGGRRNHTAVMVAGNRMVVWGGEAGGAPLADGAIFDVATNTWNASPMPTGPSGRYDHTAVVTNQNRVLVFGGMTSSGYANTGALLDPTLVQ